MTVAANLTELYDCDTATGWTAGDLDPDVKVEGSDSLSEKVSASTSAYYYDLGSGTDLSSTHIFSWMQVLNPSALTSGSGFRIYAEDTGGAIGHWYVDKNDEYAGGWRCFVVDTDTTFDYTSGGTPDLTDIQYIGVVFDMTGKFSGASNNCYWDVARYGTGLVYYGGTAVSPGDFDDFITSEESNAWGVVRKISGVYFVQGRLTLGDSAGTNNCYFEDTNKILVWEDRPVASTLYQFNIVHNATGTLAVQFGTKVGTGDTAQGAGGCIFRSVSDALSVDFSDADAESILVYGSTFLNLSGGITLSSDATTGVNHEFIGNNVAVCGQVDPGRVEVRNCNFSGYTPDGDGAMLWNANIDVKNCNFFGNTDVTNDPHAIEHPAAGTFTYDNLRFSDNDYDINNNSSATLVDSYPDTNRDSDVDLYSGSVTRLAQSFVATAGTLSRAIFSLQKVGAPTGNVVAKLYSDSGGSGPLAVVATSEEVDITGIGTSWAQVHFEFEDEFTLVVSTTYWISVEYSGGDSSNRLEVGVDSSSPTHSGSCYSYTGSWSSQTYDMCFYVNRDGVVIVNATNLSDPGTAEETATVKGATIIKTSVTLTVTCKNSSGLAIEGVRVRIETTGGTLISNGSTNALGIYSDTYNYTTDTDVNIIARLKGYVNNQAVDAITASGLSVPFTMIRDKAVNLP